MSDKLLVSVCVPTYNRAQYLSESLSTITQQDYAPLEVILSDNGSTDGTETLCRSLAARDSRIRYFRQPRNIGLYGNFNFCIEQARGEVLCLFHDDDLYDPRIVRAGVTVLRDHPDVGVVCSDWMLLNSPGEVMGVREFQVAPVTPGMQYIDQTIRSGKSSVGCSGAMIRRAALGDIRFDGEGTVGFSDFVVWFRIAERAAIGHIHEKLFSYRLHSGSLSRRNVVFTAGNYYETLSRYCDEHLQRRPEHAKLVARWRVNIKRLLFWALAYEAGLYVRQSRAPIAGLRKDSTVFEIANYRLTPEEFDQVLHLLSLYRTGLPESAAFQLIQAMLRVQMTWPLAWATRHSSAFRGILGLR